MAETMTTAEPELTILTALAPRRPDRRTVRREVRAARRKLHDELLACAAYRGGMAAEKQSSALRKEAAVKAARLAARRAVLSRTGRKIDLPALMRQRRADGKPRWALVDPAFPLDDKNGKNDSDGTLGVGAHWLKMPGVGWTVDGKVVAFKPAGGIPPLPPAVRRLAKAKAVRRRAVWVGLLYQPEEWAEAKPDPAIVVEWKDLPGQYFALAVWGADRPGIMEFVD